MFPPVNAKDARVIRHDDLPSILNIPCAIKHDQVDKYGFWINLFEQFNYHPCNISGIFLSSFSQVFGSVNNVQNNRSVIHVLAYYRS